MSESHAGCSRSSYVYPYSVRWRRHDRQRFSRILQWKIDPSQLAALSGSVERSDVQGVWAICWNTSSSREPGRKPLLEALLPPSTAALDPA